MRFADIVKNKESETLVARPEVKPKPAPVHTPPPTVPAIDQDQIKKELQEKLEQEFRKKLAQIESENQRFTEEQKKQEQSQQSFRDKQLQEEQQKMQELVRDLQKSREEVNAMRAAIENEMRQKLELEKSKLAAEKKSEQEEYQTKIREMEDQLKKKELPPQAAEPPASQVIPPKVDLKNITPLPLVGTPVPSAAPVEQADHLSKHLPPRLKPTVSFKTTLVTEKDTYQENPEAAARAREIYFDMVKSSEAIFQQIAKQEKFDLTKLQRSLGSLVDLALQSDSELIRISLEAYPEKNYFPYHAANSAILAIVLGLDFKLDKGRLEHLALAAVLHDVGLVSIQENLDYPKELSEDIKKEIVQHPVKGSEMLNGHVAPEVQNAIAQHHEACNGRGYPQALEEQQICLEAKILHVVDAFEAMTHHRAYRSRPLEVHHAVKEIIEKGRVFYDRDVMKALMGRIGLYPVNTMVTLSSKQVARVLAQNPKFPMSPVIRVEFDEFGNKLKTPFVIDLVKNQLIHVVDPVSALPSYSHTKMHRHRKSDVKDAKTVLAELLPYVLIVVIGGFLVYLVLKI